MNKKVTKIDLVDAVHESTCVEKKVIQKVVDSFLEELKNSLKGGSNIELRGFGTFELKVRNERERARNPKTGEIVSVPAHNIASFRAGQELKNALLQLPVEK